MQISYIADLVIHIYITKLNINHSSSILDSQTVQMFHLVIMIYSTVSLFFFFRSQLKSTVLIRKIS